MMTELVDHPATKRIAFALIAAVLFAGVVAAATKSDEGNVGEGRLTAHGRAAVTDATGLRREVSGVVSLHSGDIVEAIDGTMTIDLPDGSTIEGRPAFKRSASTRVKVARPAELLEGDLLVVAKNGTDVLAAGNRMHLDPARGSPNAMRASRSLAVDASVYRGRVTFDSAGQVRTIPALRALDVSVLGRPPMDFSPLALDGNDGWDRRFLGDAIDLDSTLDGYINSFSATLGTANATTPAYYRSLVPILANESGLTPDLLASTPHSPIDTIIGGAIAGLGHQGDFATRWRDVFAFKDAGARWGLVALDQQVESAALLREVQSALNTAPLSFAAAARRSAGPTPTTAPPSTTGTTTTQPTGGGPTTQPPPTSPTVPPPTVPPPPTIPTPTLPTLPPPTTPTVPPTGDPVIDGVVNTVNQLLGTMVGQPPSS